LQTGTVGRTYTFMKTLHALSLAALLSCGAVAGLGFTGCSSSSEPGAAADTGTTDDTAVATDTAPIGDTAPKTDTKVPTDGAPLVCDKLPLDPAFKCEAPTATQKGGPPSTVCTEEMLQEYATKCIAADYKVGASCGDFKSAHPECATCIGNWALDASIIPGKVYPDRDKCWYKILPDACSTSINCMFKCDDAVCADCDKSAGSGVDGKNSEYQLCVNRERKKGGTTVPKGACYDLATGAALQCLTDNSDKIDPCFVAELFSPSGTGGHPDVAAMQRESVVFMRGACRDNGDWTKSAYSCSSPPCDAGVVDAAVDTSVVTDVSLDGG
jgi:hypothetical protein